jgi:hypothetical protein
MKVQKKAESFYIIGYQLELIKKNSGDLKKKKIQNLVNLGHFFP